MTTADADVRHEEVAHDQPADAGGGEHSTRRPVYLPQLGARSITSDIDENDFPQCGFDTSSIGFSIDGIFHVVIDDTNRQ